MFREPGWGQGAPFSDGWYRVIAWHRHNQPPEDAPVSLAEVADVTRQALGDDYGMHDPRWMSRFHSDERQVPRYRDGRVLRGWAPDGLLDTYHAERHPVGRRVLRGSGALLRIGLTGPPALVAARNLLAHVATRAPHVADRLAGAISGISISYPAPRGAHPLTGKRVADLPLAEAASAPRVRDSLASWCGSPALPRVQGARV